jgi:hypothetical protein
MSDPFSEISSPTRRRRMRWIWTMIGLTPTVFLIGGWIFLDSAAAFRLKEALAEADRTDPGWRLAEVWASRAQVPDGENAALQVQMVLDRLPQDWMADNPQNETTAPQRLSALSRRLSQLDPVHRLPDEVANQLHEDLDTLKPARSLALGLAMMPKGRFEIPTRYVALLTIQRVLAQGLPSAQPLAKVQGCLARESTEPLLHFALRSDRATACETLQRWTDGGMSLSEWAAPEDKAPVASFFGFSQLPKPVITYNQAILLESMNRAVAIARQPLWEQAKLWAEFEAVRRSRGTGPARVLGALAEL